MSVGSDRFQIMLVGEKGVPGTNEIAAQIGGHRIHNVFLPQKAVPPAGSEVSDTQSWDAAEALDLVPQFRFRPRVKNVEAELAQRLQLRPRLQLVENGQRVQLPHRGRGPRSLKRQFNLAVTDPELVVG